MISCHSKKKVEKTVVRKNKSFRIRYTTNKEENQFQQTASRNIFKNAPGPRRAAKPVQTPLQTFSLFINDAMLKTIVDNINAAIDVFLADKLEIIDNSGKYSFNKRVVLIDMKAFCV